MTFILLEGGAVILVFLIVLEWRRQQLPWKRVVIRSVIILAVFTAIIGAWRGLR
jgi:hypothetical protein